MMKRGMRRKKRRTGRKRLLLKELPTSMSLRPSGREGCALTIMAVDCLLSHYPEMGPEWG